MAKLHQPRPVRLGGTPSVVAGYRPIRSDINPRVTAMTLRGNIAVQQNEAQVIAAQTGMPPDMMLNFVEAIKKNTDIDTALKLIQLGFQCQVFDLVANTPQQIIQTAKKPRGYIIINPAEVTGFSSQVTFFASAARPAATYTSSSFNVSGVDTVRLFLDVTVNGGGGTLAVNVQTQDFLSLNWATAQSDVFLGSAAVGTYYANIGPLGVDRNIRLQAVVGVAPITFSIAGLMKGGLLTPTGSTVYVGNNDVTSRIGYPILAGQRDYFFLAENVALTAISPTEPVTLKVFSLS